MSEGISQRCVAPKTPRRYNLTDQGSQAYGMDCGHEAIPDAPVPLCGQHLRETYSFAADLVQAQLPQAVVDLLAAGVLSRPTNLPREPLNLADLPDKAPGEKGWIYYVRIGDYIKIGFTTNPKNRFINLLPDEVLHLEPGTRRGETLAHERFRRFRVPGRGERFYPTPVLLDRIREMRELQNQPRPRHAV